MRENIYRLQGCDTVCPASVYLRFGPRVIPFLGFYFEVAGRMFLQHGLHDTTIYREYFLYLLLW